MSHKKIEKKVQRKIKTIKVDLDVEEFNDLEEFCKHHPEKAKDPGEALKKMAGLKFYRKLKKTVDRKRRRPSFQEEFLPQDIGVPTWIPCVLADQLKALNMSYSEFISKSIEAGAKLMIKTLEDPSIRKHLITYLKQDSSEMSIEFAKLLEEKNKKS